MNEKTKIFLKSVIKNKLTNLMLEQYNEKKELNYRNALSEKLRNKDYQEGNICIILDKGMGDFLLFAYYYEKLVEYYRSIGKEVYVICNNYNVKFLEFCRCKLPNIIFVQINENNTYIYEELLEKYSKFFEVLILPFDSITKPFCNLIRQLEPRKIYSSGNIICSLRKLSISDKKLLSEINVFEGADKGFYVKRHRILTEKLIGKRLDLMLLQLNKGEPIIEHDYYVINIGSSTTTKVWPIPNVIALVNMLEGKTKEKPIILGNASSEIIQQLESRGINCEFANLMDIKKTISLCAHAKFVVTNDTGIYHISVCLGKRTYVVSAGCYIENFMPYPEELTKQKVKYIISEKCENCNRHITCFLNRRKGKTLECLANISPQMLVNSLEDEFKDDRNLSK